MNVNARMCLRLYLELLGGELMLPTGAINMHFYSSWHDCTAHLPVKIFIRLAPNLKNGDVQYKANVRAFHCCADFQLLLCLDSHTEPRPLNTSSDSLTQHHILPAVSQSVESRTFQLQNELKLTGNLCKAASDCRVRSHLSIYPSIHAFFDQLSLQSVICFFSYCSVVACSSAPLIQNTPINIKFMLLYSHLTVTILFDWS